MFQKHFCRTTNKYKGEIPFVAASLVYQAVPGDRLVCLEDLVDRVRANCDRERERTPEPREMTSALQWLVDEGLLKEIHGAAISKFVR